LHLAGAIHARRKADRRPAPQRRSRVDRGVDQRLVEAQQHPPQFQTSQRLYALGRRFPAHGLNEDQTVRVGRRDSRAPRPPHRDQRTLNRRRRDRETERQRDGETERKRDGEKGGLRLIISLSFHPSVSLSLRLSVSVAI